MNVRSIKSSFLFLISIFSILLSSCTLHVSVSDLNAASEGTNTDSNKGEIPSEPVVVPAASATLSSLQIINSVNKSSYSISGSCSYASTVDVKINGASFGTALCSAGTNSPNGTWSKTIDVSSISDGSITFQVFDVVANAALDVKSVQKDTSIPVAALNSTPPSINSLTTILSSVINTDTSFYSYKIGLSASTDCSQALGYSSWTDVNVTVSSDISTLPDGNLRMCIVAKDQAGNVQDYTSATVYNWTKDSSIPTAVLSGFPAAITNSANYNITIGGSGVTQYSFKIGISSSTDCSNASGYSSVTSVTTWLSGSVASGDNTYKVCVVGRNAVGTWQPYASATSYTWVYDTVAPILAISSPAASSYINSANQSSYAVTSSCSENGVSVTVSATSTVNSSQISGSGTCSAGTVTVSLNLSTLVEGGVSLVSSQTDSAGNLGSSSVVSVTKDSTPPSLSGVLTDGTYYASISQSPSLSWSAATDTGGSGIQKYQIAVGTSSGGTQTVNWTDIGNVTTYQLTSLSLADGTVCYPSVRAVDVAGNTSGVITGDGWTTDVTGPTIASVEDGDQIVSTSYSSWIAWPAGTDAGSGVASYEVRIVDSGNSAVTSWTNVATALGYGFTGLSLTQGQTYKAEVRGIDNLGNIGTAVQGNGWYVVTQGWKQQAYLKASNTIVGNQNQYGYNVAASGETIVIGAPFESSNQTTITNGTTSSSDSSLWASGAAYVYKRVGTSWAQEAYLKASVVGSNDQFGVSVAISSDTIAVGDPGKNQVYIFKRSGVTWSQEAIVGPANGDNGDMFGSYVAIDGDTLVVGSPGEDSNQVTITNGSTASVDNSKASSGAVYVYKRAGASWAQEAYLKAPNADAYDQFGSKLSLSGDSIVVGVDQESSNQTTITNGTTASADNTAALSGAVYVFKRTGVNWAQEAYIKAPNAEAYDQFGYSVSISGDTLVVGSIYESSNQTTITNGTTASSDNSNSFSGAAYVYKRVGASWAQEAYLKAPNNNSSDNFGASVNIDGDIIAVGAIKESSNQTTITNSTTASSDNSATNAGAVYIFKRTGVSWAQEAYIKASNADAQDDFGVSVALTSSFLVVGADYEASNQNTITNGATASGDNSNSWSGAAYVFNVDRPATWAQQAYVKAANAEANDLFGEAVSISGDTLVVGTKYEASNQTNITNGTTASSNNAAASAGAAYVYKRTGSTWAQEAYLKAANMEAGDFYATSVAISGDTIVIGAPGEDSNQTTITNGITASSNNSTFNSGAAYVYKRTGSTWAQEAYLKAANSEANDQFGISVAISNDTIIVGAAYESSNQTTITNGTTASSDNSASGAGAAYIYKRTGSTWSQEAYLKAANSEANDNFGISVAISNDTAVVGANGEDSNQTTITNGAAASSNNSAVTSGAAYVYKRDGASWTQEAYIKAANAEAEDNFAKVVALANDTLVVGAQYEDSNQTTITNGTAASSNNSVMNSGAVYIYKRTGVTWAQEAYLKAPSVDSNDQFGKTLSISGDSVVVGSSNEASNQTTITNGTTASSDNSASGAGAAYIYKRTGGTWAQEAYVKAPNAESLDKFGNSVTISGDTVVVGASAEASNQTTITNGTTASANNSASSAGAVYIFKR